MRKPSARALSNRVTLFRYTPVQDAEGGVAPNPYGAAFATNVACSVQPSAPVRYVDATDRLDQKTMYDVIFRDNYSIVANDKIVWVDDVGTSHTLFALGTDNQAGKGSCFVVGAEERR